MKGVFVPKTSFHFVCLFLVQDDSVSQHRILCESFGGVHSVRQKPHSHNHMSFSTLGSVEEEKVFLDLLRSWLGLKIKLTKTD